MEKLISMAEKAGVGIQTFIYYAVFSMKLIEKPPVEFHEVLKQMREINSSLNRIAVKANENGLIDTQRYWENVSELQRAVGLLMEKMYS